VAEVCESTTRARGDGPAAPSWGGADHGDGRAGAAARHAAAPGPAAALEGTPTDPDPALRTPKARVDSCALAAWWSRARARGSALPGLEVGQKARWTQTVTAHDVELYAQITGDRNPLHFDADFAARTRFGRLVAQGGIAAGMLNALVAMDLPGPGTVFMSQSLKYLAPTYLDDTVTAEIEVLALKPDKPVCQLRATITNQDGTVLLEGECWTYTMRPA
jgi:acyl dehydratase